MHDLGRGQSPRILSGFGVLAALLGVRSVAYPDPQQLRGLETTPHHQSALGGQTVGTLPQNMEKAGEIYRPKKCINTRSSGYSSLWAGWPQRLPQGGG